MTTHKEYGIAALDILKGMTFCHTSDRENMIAYGECGFKGYNYSTWSNITNLQMKLEITPSMAGDSQNTCLNNYHPLSANIILQTYYPYSNIT